MGTADIVVVVYSIACSISMGVFEGLQPWSCTALLLVPMPGRLQLAWCTGTIPNA